MDEAPEWSSGRVFKVGFFAELALVLVAALMGLLLEGVPFPFHIDFAPKDFLLAAAATAPLLGIAYFLTSSAGRRIAPFERIYKRVKDIVGAAVREMSTQHLVLLAGAAGIGEEVLFRGVLQGVIGLSITSLIFALLHALTATYFALAFLLSLYLGWVYGLAGNLLVPILIHWIYDFFALYLLRQRFQDDAAREAQEGRAEGSSGPAPPDLPNLPDHENDKTGSL